MNLSAVTISQDRDELQRQADAELARRSVLGVWGFPVLLLLFFLTTTYVRDHPTLAMAGISGVVLSLVSRVYLTIRRDAMYASNPGRWRGLFASSILAGALCWGGLFTMATIFYPASDWTRIVLLFCILGGCPTSLTVLTPNRTLVTGHHIVMLLPSIMAQACSSILPPDVAHVAASILPSDVAHAFSVLCRHSCRHSLPRANLLTSGPESCILPSIDDGKRKVIRTPARHPRPAGPEDAGARPHARLRHCTAFEKRV